MCSSPPVPAGPADLNKENDATEEAEAVTEETVAEPTPTAEEDASSTKEEANDANAAPTSPGASTDKAVLYNGFWTDEEKLYATALIDEFRNGSMPDVAEGATLRAFLASKLSCPTKRISKKYESSGTSFGSAFFPLF